SRTGSKTVTVTPANAFNLTVAGFTNPVNAGVAGNVTVTAKDSFGNVATGYTGTVRITSSDGAAVLPANYPYVAGNLGVHQFAVTLKTAGGRSITATDTVTGSITGPQTAIQVNPAAAASLTAAPTGATTATSGTPVTNTVTA